MKALRPAREARGLSQQALAERVGLSRQAYGAIEAGRSVPGVDTALALARALQTTVEALCRDREAETPAVRAVAVADVVAGARVSLARVGGVVVAVPVPATSPARAADGRVVGDAVAGAVVDVDAFGGSDELAQALQEQVVVAGCALALGVIAARLNASPGAGRFLWWPTSNAAARVLLGRGHVHLAAVHHANREPQAADRQTMTLGRWALGCATRADDRRVTRGDELAGRPLRLVHREPGAGAEALLRELVGDAGPDGPVVTGHLDVARAVACGAGDVGICAQDAALSLGLRFVPVREERVVLHLPRVPVADVRVARFLDAVTTRAVRAELSALGYDTRESGAAGAP
jgi:DNA-binding XRE family transcriptional regulator